MDIHSAVNYSASRAVSPSQQSHDRQSRAQNQLVSREDHVQKQQLLQQKASNENRLQEKENEQRRLDGRFIHPEPKNTQQSQHQSQRKADYTRARVNQAYQSASSSANKASSTDHPYRYQQPEAINLVV